MISKLFYEVQAHMTKLKILLTTLIFTLLGTLIPNESLQAYSYFDNGCSQFCQDCNTGTLSSPPPLGCCGYYVGADFLYWTNYQPGLDYAADALAGGDRLDGKIHLVDYDWSPGFRVYGGYRFGCEGWDGRLVYTYWCDDPSASTTASTDHLKPSLITPDWGKENANEAEIKLCTDYKVLDLLFSYPLCVTSNLNWRPYFGARAVWLEQELKATYSGGNDFNNNNVVKWKNDFCGAGLNAGLDCSTSIRNCFVLNFEFGGSIIAGEADDHHEQIELVGDGPAVNDTRIDLKKSECLAIPGYHLGVNVSWEKCCECANFVVSLGYEMNHWFQTPNMSRYVDETLESVATSGSCGSLLLHGLTVRGEVHF